MADVTIGSAGGEQSATLLRDEAAPRRVRLPSGSWRDALREINAGTIVALQTLPMIVSAGVLAFAPLGPDYIAEGAATGILCAVAGGVTAALLRSSAFIATSPTVPGALIQGSLVSTLLMSFGDANIPTVLALLSLAVMLSAFWQVVFAWSGLVRIVKFTPYPVLAGFVTGLSLKTFIGQAPQLFGLASLAELGRALGEGHVPHLPMALFGLAVIVLIRLSDHVAPRLPSILVGLVVGALAWHGLTRLWPDLELGRTIGAISLGKASIGFSIGLDTLTPLLTTPAIVEPLILTSLTLAAVGMIDFTFAVRTAQNLCDLHLSPRRDLAGQGAANLVSGIVGGMAVTSSLSQSVQLFEMGGRTRIAPLSLSLVLFLAALAAPSLIAAMPIVVLTAMLIAVAWKMWDRWCFSVFRFAFTDRNPAARTRARRNLAIVAAVMAATVLGQPVLGAVVGVLLSCLVFIMEMSRPVIRRRLDCTHVASKRIRSQAERAVLAAHGGRMVVLDLQGVLFFGNADDLSSAIQTLPPRTAAVILDLHRVTDLDTSGATVLFQIARRCEENGMRLALAGALPKYADFLHDTLKEAPAIRYFPDLDAALEAAEDQVLARYGAEPSWSGLAIHETDLAGGLSEDERAALSARLTLESYKAGEALCRAGEPADRLWILTRGSVSVRVAGALHDRRIAALGPGTSVGEMGLLDRRPRSADVVADVDVEAYVLTVEDFDELLRDEARLGQSLLATIARLTAQRLRETSDELRLAEA